MTCIDMTTRCLISRLTQPWRCPQDVQLALQLLPLPGQLGALSRMGEALGMMQPLRVGLASLIFSGRVRVALKPLMNKLPIVAAMQARSTHCLCVACG